MSNFHKGLSRVTIVGSVATLISIFAFMRSWIGSVVTAQNDIDDLLDFKTKQETINTKNIETFSVINTNLEWIKWYLKTNLK